MLGDLITEAQHSSVVVHDSYDERVYRETASVYPGLGDLVATNTGAFPLAGGLVEDVFYSLYKPVPIMGTETELSPAQQVTARLLGEMMQTTEYTQVRDSTIGDNFASAIGTVAVGGSILKSLDSKTKQRLQDLADLEADAATLFNQAQALEDFSKHAGEEQAAHMQEQAEEMREEAQQKTQQAQTQAGALDAQMEELEDTVRRAARVGLDQAAEELENAEQAVKAFSGGYSLEPGQPQQVFNIREKIALAQRVANNRKLQMIAEVAGRMVRTALYKQKTKVLHPPDEVIGITIGDEISRTLPSDLALLSDPLLEDLFFARMLGEKLMIYDMRGSEKQGRGPIIFVIDSSGSMEEVLGAMSITKEVWSKACGLALLAIAKRQRRDFVFVHFASPGQVKEFRFLGGEATSKTLLACCEFFYNGGTDFEAPMKKALEIVEESRFSKADVIWVSDGQVNLPKELETDWNTRRKAKEMHCFSIFLQDPHDWSAPRWRENLERMSDSVTIVTDLAQDAEALETMFTI